MHNHKFLLFVTSWTLLFILACPETQAKGREQQRCEAFSVNLQEQFGDSTFSSLLIQNHPQPSLSIFFQRVRPLVIDLVKGGNRWDSMVYMLQNSNWHNGSYTDNDEEHKDIEHPQGTDLYHYHTAVNRAIDSFLLADILTALSLADSPQRRKILQAFAAESQPSTSPR